MNIFLFIVDYDQIPECSARRIYRSDIIFCVIQWKVRRTLAFSLHELAIILGEAITISDLLPTFDDFIKDLDEVRIGILKHLADFLRVWIKKIY